MFAINSEPRYEHDCDGCMYLGNYEELDVYYCCGSDGISGGSVILRFGDEGWEYTSSPVSCALYSEPGLSRGSDILKRVAGELLRKGYIKICIGESSIEEDRGLWGDFWEMRKGQT
jgi:hypothetical protein